MSNYPEYTRRISISYSAAWMVQVFVMLTVFELVNKYIEEPTTTHKAVFNLRHGRADPSYFYKTNDEVISCDHIRCGYTGVSRDDRKVVEIRVDQKNRVAAVIVDGRVRFDESTLHARRMTLYIRIAICQLLAIVLFSFTYRFYKKQKENVVWKKL